MPKASVNSSGTITGSSGSAGSIPSGANYLVACACVDNPTSPGMTYGGVSLTAEGNSGTTPITEIHFFRASTADLSGASGTTLAQTGGGSFPVLFYWWLEDVDTSSPVVAGETGGGNDTTRPGSAFFTTLPSGNRLSLSAACSASFGTPPSATSGNWSTSSTAVSNDQCLAGWDTGSSSTSSPADGADFTVATSFSNYAWFYITLNGEPDGLTIDVGTATASAVGDGVDVANESALSVAVGTATASAVGQGVDITADANPPQSIEIGAATSSAEGDGVDVALEATLTLTLGVPGAAAIGQGVDVNAAGVPQSFTVGTATASALGEGVDVGFATARPPGGGSGGPSGSIGRGPRPIEYAQSDITSWRENRWEQPEPAVTAPEQKDPSVVNDDEEVLALLLQALTQGQLSG